MRNTSTNNQLVNNDNLLDVINWTIDRLPNNRIIIFLITLILTRAFVNFAGCSLATMATQSQYTCANNKTFERLRVTRQQYVTSTLHLFIIKVTLSLQSSAIRPPL
jgi:p-aminobenzoyl-glutamate transporter AbgT